MRYDLSLLSVLLVEDSMFMRNILRGVMQALGVGKLHVANDGEDAIDLLRQLSDDAAQSGYGSVDMIIVDLFMPKVDGLMMLRWLRRHDESPNRFMPVIMMSGMTDQESLTLSRDAGVTEFVSKPFSVEGLAKRMVQTINNPRQFVYTPSYFGPDRRRRKSEVEEERRFLTESDCEIVYSGKAPGAFHKDKPSVWLFRLQNRLKEKLASGGSFEDGDAEIDADLLELAREQIANMEDDYSDWVEESIVTLISAHRRAADNPADCAEELDTINSIAHELRGQGGIFGYPLMTDFGRSLYDVTQPGTKPSGQLIELIKAHIDGIRAVMAERIKGDGGAIGQELMKSLELAKQKHGKPQDARLSRAGP